ncbi:MAG TPA: hypothetical protein VHZ56_08335, partial [Devosia sp.]|nr:hypothetical protein [Devosia sp.]
MGFALAGAATLTLLTAAPALSQGLSSSSLIGAVPLAIALGAGAFALLAMAVVRTMVRDGRQAQQRAAGRIADLRAQVDEYEALLSGTGEITVVWGGKATGPKFLGPASAALAPGRRVDAILDFPSWLGASDAALLAERLTALRSGGQGFDLPLLARDGRQMRALGWALG